MMFYKFSLIIISFFLLLIISSTRIFAIDEAELAAESEAYCKSTAQKRPTPPEMIINRVNEACKLLQTEGTAAFPKFKGTGSNFLFEGTYIWIHSLTTGEMLMHPIKYKMQGNRLIGLKDTKGKRFFVVMNQQVREKGAAWVEYYWPKPGTNEIVRKISYVKGCKTADGIDVVIGCGIYNASDSDLAGLEIY